MKISSRSLLLGILWLLPLVVGFLVGRQMGEKGEGAEEAVVQTSRMRGDTGGVEARDERRKSSSRTDRETPTAVAPLTGSAEERVEQAYDKLVALGDVFDPIERNRELIQLIDQLAPGEYQNLVMRMREDMPEDLHRGTYHMIFSGLVEA